MELDSIGARVRDAMSRRASHLNQGEVAEAVDMAADRFSRSLNGSRAFSSLELARVADFLGEDVRWLITGNADPLRVRIAARHDWDADARQHRLPGDAESDDVLAGFELAYRQAHPWLADPIRSLPADPGAVRESLGDGFAFTFVERVEAALGVDVARIKGTATDYSFTVGDRPVILLKAQPLWFRSNWSLAHEIAHLALQHHDITDNHTDQAAEVAANRFAAELLLPEAIMRSIAWADIDDATLARHVWAFGVSTEALANRIDTLRLTVPSTFYSRLQGGTMQFLRRSQHALPVTKHPGTPFVIVDPITHRFNGSDERRIPEALISAHLAGIAEGRLNKGTLAWLLETTAEALDVDEPQKPPAMDTEDLMAELGI